MRRLLQLGALFLLGLCAGAASAQYATLTGSLQSTNGMPASNYIINFTPSQFGFVANTAIIVNTSTECATSTDGSVVGVPNPLAAPPVTVAFTGTLTPANYFVKYAFYDASGNLTLVSPETVIQLNSTGQLIVASPSSGMPAGSVGMKVYISASTNAETLQGSTTGSAAFIQSVPLTSGAAVPSTNTTVCKQIANDAIWPSGTGYTVSLTDPSGNTIPGYPMQWQLMGPNSTINLSDGLPYYHGTVYFPSPILASPINHNLQSISGPLGLSGYNLTNVGAIGVGTSLPAWPIDVENGGINSLDGYKVNGGAGANGQVLCSDGNFFDLPCTVYSPSNPPPETTYTFSARFAVSGTAVDLATVGTAGACANPTSVTTDAWGRVTGCTAGSSSAPTCNANGCYSLRPDGWYDEWGNVNVPASGNAFNTATVTFPLALTTATNLVPVGNTIGVAGSGDPTTPPAVELQSVSTTGAVFYMARVIIASAGGGNFDNALTLSWRVIGH